MQVKTIQTTGSDPTAPNLKTSRKATENTPHFTFVGKNNGEVEIKDVAAATTDHKSTSSFGVLLTPL